MGCISLIEKKKKKQTSLVLNGGNLNSERYRDEILQLVAIPYFLSPGPNSVLQDDNACPMEQGLSEITLIMWGGSGEDGIVFLQS